jgi:hypothetical protein
MIVHPIAVVSDSKDHDSNFVQHFLDEDLFGPNGWLYGGAGDAKFPGLSTRFKMESLKLGIRSDGAASHFKSRFSIDFMCYLKSKYGFARVHWTFGAPGHGKGPWDGFGGIIKNYIARRIISEGLTFQTEQDLYDYIKKCFDSFESVERFGKVSTTIKTWTVLFVKATALAAFEELGNLRRSKDDVRSITAFEHAAGTRSIFSYEALTDSCLACRINGCWCNFCCAVVVLVVEYGGRDGKISSVQVPGCLRQDSSPFGVCYTRIDAEVAAAAAAKKAAAEAARIAAADDCAAEPGRDYAGECVRCTNLGLMYTPGMRMVCCSEQDCNLAYHIKCIGRGSRAPVGDWYCSACSHHFLPEGAKHPGPRGLSVVEIVLLGES